MKKLLFIIILFMCSQQFVFSEFVTPGKAQTVARHFYFEKFNFFKSIDYIDLKISDINPIYKDDVLLYYIFTIRDHGFIIISGDDIAFPVVGYSFDQQNIEQGKSPEFLTWMEQYEKQLLEIKTRNLKATPEISKVWQYYVDDDPAKFKTEKKGKGILPLLISLWGQGAYYNAMCPADPEGSGGHALAGCVAIAMAQVMYYYRYPETGDSSHGYECDYGYEFADFENTHYKWDEMVNSIYNLENNAIAELIYHVGVSLEMNYGTTGSGSNTYDTPDALKNFFRYSNDASYIMRSNQTISFKDSLINDLDQKRPLIYRGGDIMASHSFVCDGYQDSTFFHFNWGWNGSWNGYFYIDNLNPAGYNLTYGQAAVINIHPRENYPVFCSGYDTLTALRGTFEDGSGIENYQNNISCSWLIKPDNPAVTNIQFWFTKLNTEPGQDIITVYDGDSEEADILGMFSGSEIPPVITSAGNAMLIEFTSDTAGTNDGWMAEYMAYSSPFCNSGNVLTSLSTSYFSDNSGPYNYTNNSDCTWLIDPQNEIYDSVSSIDLNFYNIQLGEGDTVFVFDGNSDNASLLSKITDDENPGTIHSTGNKIFIAFRTNEETTGAGWTAGYTSLLPVYCNDTTILTGSSGTFEDGSGAKTYNNNTECYWMIAPENAISITLSFTKFDIEYGYDQVKIYNAGEKPPVLLATYWGHEIPPSFTMTGNKMLLSFKSDFSQVFDGWEAVYSTDVASVQETDENIGCRIVTNPVSNTLKIEIRNTGSADISVGLYDMLGNSVIKKVYTCSQGLNQLKIDVASFDQGIYFIRIDGLQKEFVSKIIIAR